MSWRLLTDDGADAADGLATDEALMHAYRGATIPEPTLRLYTYRTHCALVGRFQDPAAELNLERCEATGTQVNRRPTGGGAIIMGERQLGVALVTSLRDPRTPTHARAIIDTFGGAIARALASLGIDGEVRGKNDIAVEGRKITGLGIYVDAHDAVLFHASVLVGLDVDFMLRVLNIPAAKLADKAIRSVRQRITTISEQAGREVATDDARARVAGAFAETFGVTMQPDALTPDERALVAEVSSQRYGDASWVFQRTAITPEGTSILKTPGGLLRISLELSGNALKDVQIFGDFMATETAVPALEAALRWVAADRDRVTEAIAEGWRRGGGLQGVPTEDLVAAIWQAVVDARARRGAAGSCYYPETTQTGDAQTASGSAMPEEATAWR